jgi:hypothetical protein
MANISIEDLSLTISEIVELEPEQQNLIESAVNRVIAAKDITGGFSVAHVPIRVGLIVTLDDISPKPTFLTSQK